MSGLFGRAMRFAKSKQGKEAIDKVKKYAQSDEGKERIQDVKGRLSGKHDEPVPKAEHEAPKPDPAAPKNPEAPR